MYRLGTYWLIHLWEMVLWRKPLLWKEHITILLMALLSCGIWISTFYPLYPFKVFSNTKVNLQYISSTLVLWKSILSVLIGKPSRKKHTLSNNNVLWTNNNNSSIFAFYKHLNFLCLSIVFFLFKFHFKDMWVICSHAST